MGWALPQSRSDRFKRLPRATGSDLIPASPVTAAGGAYCHFRPRCHLMTAGEYRRARAKAFRIWRQETYARMPA
jgi:hypothetical protein